MEHTKKIIEYFEEHDNSILEIIQLEELQDVVSLAFFILNNENDFGQEVKKKAFKLLCRIVKMDRFTIEERWAMYINIESIAFLSYTYDDFADEREEFNSILETIQLEELQDIISLAFFILNNENDFEQEVKKNAFKLLCRTAKMDRFTIEERWTMYINIERIAFLSYIYDDFADEREEIYPLIYKSVEKKMPAGLLEVDNVSNDGPVVIITSQFLTTGHAPTRQILDYAYTIQQKMGVKVVIINDTGLKLKQFSYMQPSFQGNYVVEYENLDKISYKDTYFSFYQTANKNGWPDLKEIENIVYNIKKLGPRLVLNVGGDCLTSDLCRKFAKTAVSMCSTSMPSSMSEWLVLNRNIRRTDKARMEKKESYQKIVESTFNYIMPDEKSMKKYVREQWNIPDGAWIVITVGNRMDDELEENFLKTMDCMLDTIEDAYFMVVGEVKDPKIYLEKFKNSGRVCFTGELQDASQVIRLANVYVQPKRKGGGRAAFESLYYGVPVIIPNYGDAWDVTGEDFSVESYEQMLDIIIKFYNDRNYYNKFRVLSKEKGLMLQDMKTTFCNLFNKIGVEYKDNESVLCEGIYTNLFKTESEKKLDLILENVTYISKLLQFNTKRLRDIEWAEVFFATINGSEWLQSVPLSPGRCALGWPGLYALYRSLDEVRPKNILEMGLGQSTRLIEHYAKYYNSFHYIVENNKPWIDFFLNKHGINKNSEIVYLDANVGVYNGRWIQTKTPIKYYENFANSFANKKFDFIFIDGPNGSEEYSRVDFTELLPEALEDSFVIMIDDSERIGEKRTIQIISEILSGAKIPHMRCTYDGLKDTELIVSKDLQYLCSL